jgi:hypothetical protein
MIEIESAGVPGRGISEPWPARISHSGLLRIIIFLLTREARTSRHIDLVTTGGDYSASCEYKHCASKYSSQCFLTNKLTDSMEHSSY